MTANRNTKEGGLRHECDGGGCCLSIATRAKLLNPTRAMSAILNGELGYCLSSSPFW